MSSNLVYEIPLTQEQRYQIIRQEFAQIGISSDAVFNRDQLLSALDKKLRGHQFDRGIAIELYDRIQNEGGYFRFEEFIKVFCEAEDTLIDKIKDSQQIISHYDKQRKEAEMKLNELRQQEQINTHGIMEGSVLTTQVCEVQDLHPDINGKNIYVSLNIEKNSFRTTSLPFQEYANFDQSFNATIITGVEEINIQVVSEEYGQFELAGKVQIPLSSLRDQYKHDEWFDLYDEQGHVAGGKIHLVLQWIHSKVRYIGTVVKKWTDHIRMQNEDNQDYQRDLVQLYELVPTLQQEYKNNLRNHNSYAEKQGVEVQKQGAYSNYPEHGLQSSPVFQLSQAGGIHWENMGVFGQLAFYSTLGLLVLSLFSCFGKADFVNLFVSVAVIMNYDTKRRFAGQSQTLKYLMYILAGSVLFDIIWLSIFTSVRNGVEKGWSGRVKGYEGNQDTLEFVLFLQYFCLLVKGAMLFFYFNFHKMLQNEEIRQPQINVNQQNPTQYDEGFNNNPYRY